MADETFVDGQEPTVNADWLNAINDFYYTLFAAATTAAQARTALALGSMALQAASAVAITGGTIAGITSETVSGVINLTGVITPTILSASQNNYNPTNLSSARVVRLKTDGSDVSITGIAAQASGRVITFIHVEDAPDAGGSITFIDNSASSLQVNRMKLGAFQGGSGHGYTLRRGQTLTLWYDAVSGYWRPESPVPILLAGENTYFQTISGSAAFSFLPTDPTGGGPYVITAPGRSLTLCDGPTLDTAKVTTSGTTWDFTIPSWVNKITAMYDQFSTNGTSEPLIQLGTGGVPTTSGYRGSVSGFTAAAVVTENSTTGALGGNAASGAAGAIWGGSIVFTRLSGNTWTFEGGLGRSDTTFGSQTRGSVTLAGALDFLRFTTLAGDTGDAGSVNVMME